ncbi:hypothetical protein [Lacrimispora saccharolytica]|uniref:hypothetical protein n=1 Tax=Lacrimispora saccharolytica TaxID=84030 RepID=UPI00265D12EC|nr:hypothetical protein [Lacrimispora saccharolytica]MCF2655740.1 hypothetical protein [Lacrimispora saccharolytica]
MVKRRLKRVLATVIVMTMVAGMNLTVFAEEGGSNANNSTGTVSGNAVEKEEPIDVSEMAQKAAEEAIKIEEALPVESFISEGAVKAIPAEAKEAANATAGMTTYNLTSIKTVKGFTAAVRKIAKADPETQSVLVYSNKPITFSVETLNAVQDANKEFVYMFKHKGHLYKVTIPAGAKVDLRGEYYAGPLFIGSVLGTSQIVE